MVGIATFAMFCGDKQLVQGLAITCDFVGVCLVAADLLNIYRKHRVDGPIARLKSYFQDFPLWCEPRHVVVNVPTLNLALTAHGVRLAITIPEDASVEQKVDFLMRRVEELGQGLHHHHENLAVAERRLTADIAGTRQLIDRQRTQIAQRLRSIEVGDLFLTPLGLLYVAVGAALNFLALLSF